jgi:hypothetical protein
VLHIASSEGPSALSTRVLLPDIVGLCKASSILWASSLHCAKLPRYSLGAGNNQQGRNVRLTLAKSLSLSILKKGAVKREGYGKM